MLSGIPLRRLPVLATSNVLRKKRVDGYRDFFKIQPGGLFNCLILRCRFGLRIECHIAAFRGSDQHTAESSILFSYSSACKQSIFLQPVQRSLLLNQHKNRICLCQQRIKQNPRNMHSCCGGSCFLYATSYAFILASFCLRRRMTLGVISTNSSSLI